MVAKWVGSGERRLEPIAGTPAEQRRGEMNKADLTEAVAVELGQPKAMATKSIDAVLHGILEGVRRDGSVTLVGFGTFERRERAARMGRNPVTKEPIEIAASWTIGFRPAAAAKASMAPAPA